VPLALTIYYLLSLNLSIFLLNEIMRFPWLSSLNEKKACQLSTRHATNAKLVSILYISLLCDLNFQNSDCTTCRENAIIHYFRQFVRSFEKLNLVVR